MAERAFVSLGSNVDPERNLLAALARLAEVGAALAVSGVYQSPAVGPRPAPDFLNAAVLIATEMPPQEIRLCLRQIESDLGRVRGNDPYAPRTIDLDLCLLGSLVLDTPSLRLPDPDILTRAYLAVTLAELAPDFVHPETGETLAAIAGRLAPDAQLIPRPELSRLVRRLISPLG